MGAVGCDLPHACSMAAQGHKSRNNGRFPEANVATDYYTPIYTVIFTLQLGINLMEEPIPAHKRGIRGDTRHLKQKWLQGDVRRPVGSKAN